MFRFNHSYYSEDNPYELLPKILEEIRDRIDKRLIDNNLITDVVMKDVLTCIYSIDQDLLLEQFELINAFLTPKLQVNLNKYASILN